MTPPPLFKVAATLLFATLIGLAWALGNGGLLGAGPFLQLNEAEGEAAKLYGFVFRDVTKECGIEFVHSAPVFDKKIDNVMSDIASVGAAVSVADVNNDGFPDLYFTNSDFGKHNALYIHNGSGKWNDVAAEAGVADVNKPGEGVSMGSIWGDIDNDGREDLFIYKYGYTQLFHNESTGGTVQFKDISQAAGVRRWLNANSACFVDFDRDGLLDLYVCGYFRDDIDFWNLKNTRFRQESMEFARNGGHKYLYKNLGNHQFKDVTAEMGVDNTRFTLAVASADFNDDGWPDLYLANDFGVEILYLNEEGKHFRELTGAGLSETSKSGMCVAVGDCGNQGKLDVFVTNITKAGFNAQGNNLRINKLGRTGKFMNMAEGELADCGWAWGAQFGDFNNDGAVDLFVANGYISASPTEEYWYDMSKMAAGSGALIEDSTNWPTIGNKSLSGYERSRVLLNNGAGAFGDVAEKVGVRDLLDGRSVCLADLFQTGSLDVIVANQKGAPLVYHSVADPKNHWIQFQFKASKSNKSAIGADLLLEWNAGGERRMQRRVVDGGSGFSSQNERKLHFGLGASASDAKATLRWPSGTLQKLDSLEIDKVNVIREP